MDFSIDPFRRDALSSATTTAGRTPAEYVEELSFQNELAALQIDNPTADNNGESGLSFPLSTFSPYANLLSSNRNMTASQTAPSEPDSVDVESIQIPNSLAAVNNNPGNLRFAHQTGAAPGVGGFAQFDTPEDGFQALLNQVRLDAGRGYTLSQYITKYAPPSENDTALYIQQASQALGVSPNAPLASADLMKVAIFQARKETGTIVAE